MKIIKAKDYNEMSRKAANIISAQIIMKPDSVLGLATGSSPIGTYKQLIEGYQNGDLTFENVKSVNLDEYKGLGGEHNQSYRYFMENTLFSKVDIKKENTYVPNGLAENDEEECGRYDSVIADMGGVDLQLLGIGHNGHIAFNEPSDTFPKGTHCVELTESTITANSRLFAEGEAVPTYAFTMGIKAIMQAKKILLIASGADKAAIVKEAFFGPITPNVPASILQMHPDCTVVADEAALAFINE